MIIIIILSKWLNSSIWTINGTLTDTTNPGQSGPRSNSNERVLHIFQNFKLELTIRCSLVSYPGHSLKRKYDIYLPSNLPYKNYILSASDRSTRVGWKVHRMTSYQLLMIFYQWDPSTTILTEEMCGSQRGPCWKTDLIWSHSMRVSWSAYELFSQPSYDLHNISLSVYQKIHLYLKLLFWLKGKKKNANNKRERESNTAIHQTLIVCFMIMQVGWVLWHTNPCRLFNTKSYLYIHMICKQIVCS